MSNQVFKNQVARYKYNKENLYDMTAPQVIPQSTETNVTYDTVVKNEIGAGLSYVGGVFKVIGEEAEGLYSFSCSALWQSSATGLRDMWIKKNVETARRSYHRFISSATDALPSTSTSCVDMQLGDEVRIIVTQSSGGNTNILNGFSTAVVVTLIN